MIDDEGNLKLAAYDPEEQGHVRMGGYLLVDGIPWSLRAQEVTDPYFPF
jgi:hypothetical protein